MNISEKASLLENKLNSKTKEERLEALKNLMTLYSIGEVAVPPAGKHVNNHIHTTFSFSPYSPTSALYTAWKNGLATAGIMDHDSISGAEEFLEAGEIINKAEGVRSIMTTCGFEQRISFKNTPFEGKRLNNPDQLSVAYVALHGIPKQSFALVKEYLAPYVSKRNERNVKMVEKINSLVASKGMGITFEEVKALSENDNGGSITERHVLFALTKKILEKKKTPDEIISFIENDLGYPISESNKKRIYEFRPEFIEYDVLGILKSGMIKSVYVDADEECPDIKTFIDIAKKAGGISAYAYLGDVGDSVTGDKKAQTFEDSFLDDLVLYLKECGFDSVTYMPSRNTTEQLRRLMALCDRNELFQISGEDINSPRQSFTNDKILSDEYKHLVSSTYALIGHEKAANVGIEKGMFSASTKEKMPALNMRTEYFANFAKSL
ncbi:MAG: PHP domain-containing protein [Ruminococcaceae bacterium]|nr:PHP domain-containing protein [Oscillospiraceae bacterium]